MQVKRRKLVKRKGLQKCWIRCNKFNDEGCWFYEWTESAVMIDTDYVLLCPFTPLVIPYAKDVFCAATLPRSRQMIVYLDLSRASRAAGKSSALVRT